MCDKLNISIDYRSEVMRLIRDLTTVHYYPASEFRDSSVLEPLTQRKIAQHLGVTFSTVSRAATGVCSLSGEAFYMLIRLHRCRLSGTIGFNPLNTDLPF